MHRSLTLRTFFIASNVVLGVAFAGDAQAATPTYYNNQATFNAAIGTSKTDDYSNPGYMFIQNNAQMSAVFNETDYESTGFQNLNIVSGGFYCAGCNGSFRLTFTTTSVGTPQGVEAVGLTIPTHNLGVPYFAFITFGDNTTANIALPAAGSFWGVSAPERITSIHMGLANGGTTTSGSFGIDNLTIAQSKAVCGNGKVEGMEACDDGNMVDTDMCTNACKVAACGDKIVQMGVEECDDGNMVDTDACTNACKNAVCGDSIVQDGVEACDDGNMVDTDACVSGCKNATCGDGFVQDMVEACDDGNMVDNDMCTNACISAKCGDGIVEDMVEACDDGNQVDDDGCSNACMLPACGDGILQMGEACDDGNQVDEDGCTNACALPACGDGIVQMGEECDDPNDPSCVDCVIVGGSTGTTGGGTTGSDTTGSDTTGPATTGPEPTGTGGTGGGTGEGTGTDGTSGVTAGGTTGDGGSSSGDGSASDTGGGASDGGCGCTSSDDRSGLLGLLSFGLLGLRRRRPSRG